jgi:site-specific DNA recombinase
MQVSAALRNHDSLFRQQPAHLVHQGRVALHQLLAHAMDRLHILLCRRLDRNEAHRWPTGGLAYCLGVAGVVLVGFDIGPDEPRIDQPHLMSELLDLARPIVRSRVYKVDRLTRSLADFAKMVELFDAQRVSFVAVTQQFNTTTSMGRLTLNVLLSFAQFEREVIGERIRDKIAASKRKGMWVGGGLPMGYEVHDRKLVVNLGQARTVRQIFERYLEIGSVRLLKNDLDRRGIVSGVKVSKNGKRRGGKPFSRGSLYCLLSNPIYLGEIRHKDERHPGQHEAIVSRELWERVQQRLRARAVRRGEGRRTEAPQSPLAGKLFDENGEPLYVQGAAKGHRRYRYYVSKKLVRSGPEGAEHGWRLSAAELERSVSAAAREILADRDGIAQAIEESGVDAHRLPAVLRSAQAWIERLRTKREAAVALAELIEQTDLSRDGIQVSLKVPIPPVEEQKGVPSRHIALTKFVPMQMKRRGVEMRMVLDGDSAAARVDLPLLKAVARAHRWFQDLISGRVQSVSELARREELDRRSVHRLLRLAFLSPRVVEAIAEGRQPPDLTVIGLSRRVDIPLLWRAQEQALGIR